MNENFFSKKYSWKKILYALIALAFILLYAKAHFATVFTMPVPWPDESAFLFPAINFAEHNSLLAPQLNPDRHLMWMPPGFMIAYGLLQKVFGTSLTAARIFSTTFIVGAFAFLLAIIRRYEEKFFSLLLCGFFLLSANFVVAGNIARMEALLLFVISAGFFFLQRKNFLAGISLLFLSPLIHPNGAYFAIGGIFFLIIEEKILAQNPDQGSEILTGHASLITRYALPITVFLCWLGYVIYISQHWPEFQHDMNEQLRRKASRHFWEYFSSATTNIVLLFVLPALYVYTLWRKIPARFLFYFLIPAWLIKKIGQESWYSVFDSLFFLLLSVLLIEIISFELKKFSSLNKIFQRLAMGCVFIAISVVLIHSKFIQLPIPDYPPNNWEWYTMKIQQNNAPYYRDSDKEKISSFLDSLHRHDKYLEVQFFPEGEILLYQDLQEPTLILRHPLYYERVPDVYIIHKSRYLAHWWREYIDQAFRKMKITPVEEGNFLFSRDSTEFWYYRMVDPAKKKEYEKIRW